MDKLQMCRICLAEDVRMYVVVNKDLRELYEKLTDIPFVTADRRPILVCFFCCAKLKQCCRLMRKCLEADEIFTQILNEDYEPNALINLDTFKALSGFDICPIENISIVDNCHTESIAIKEELPADCHELEDITEPQEDSLSNDIKPENIDNSCLDLADIPSHHSESESEVDVPLIDKTAGEETLEASKKKRRAVETNSARGTRRTTLEDTNTAELKKNEPTNLKVFRTTRNRTSKPGTSFEEPDECDQRSLNEVKKRKQHTQTRISKKRYECDVCQHRYAQKGNLTRHILMHTGEKPYKCDVCQRSFSEKHSLTRHIRIHTGEKPYKCDVCQRSFSENCSLTKHIRIHTGEKPYKCDVCQRSFSEKRSLTKHIRIHTGEKPYKCNVCQRSFNEKRSLTNHIRIHTGEKPYKCGVCQRSFRETGSLTKHIRIHTGEKPYKCNVCQRCFSQKGHLAQHIQIHTGEKPYKCDVCQRSFNQKISLTQHIRTHTGEKPYKCDVCQLSFSEKSNLNKHISIHTGLKLYECDVCQRSFTRKANLTRHIRIHTGKKPYQCNLCLRRFSRKSDLIKHIIRIHF